MRSVVERVVRHLVRAVADERHRDAEHLAVRRRVRVDRLQGLAGCDRLLLQVGDSRLQRRIRRVALDRDDGRGGAAGERVPHLVERLDFLERLRQGVEARLARVEAQGREGQEEQHRGRRDRGDERAAEDGAEHRTPDATLAVVLLEPAEERDAHLVDPVAEPREDRGQDGERADHRDGDDHHRPDREGHERLVAGEEHAGHRDHHGDARDEHGPARRRCGSLEGGGFAASGATLVTFAADVEQRVVDADREPDQQDDLGDRLVHRHDLARQGDEAQRCEHGRQGEPERDERADERAEHEQQDHERDRDRDHPGAGQLRVEHRVERLAGRRRAGLDHGVVGVGLLHLGGAGDDRVDVGGGLVVGALGAELDQHRVAVLRDLPLVAGRERRAELGHLRIRLELRDRGRDDGTERGIGRRLRLRLHEHVLALLVQLEAGVADDVVGLAGLAHVDVVLVDRHHPDAGADRKRRDHERQPAENGGLAVFRTPTTHPGRDVRALLQG